MYLPLPMFVLRRIVRRNPWLLANDGVVRRAQKLDVLGVFDLEIESAATLSPKQKAILQAEASAGKLFR